MPWQCHLVDRDTFYSPGYAEQHGDLVYRCPPEKWPAVVAAWRSDGARRDHPTVERLSDQYLAGAIDRRPPLWVILPNGDRFNIDGNVKGTTRGWNVTGDPPKLTVTPSIDCSPGYHGHLTDGVLSDG